MMKKILTIFSLLLALCAATAQGDTLLAQKPSAIDARYIAPAVSLKPENFLDDLLFDDDVVETRVYTPPARPKKHEARQPGTPA